MPQLNSLTNHYCYSFIESPLGLLELKAVNGNLAGVNYVTSNSNSQLNSATIQPENQAILAATQQQLSEYFQGNRKTFNLPLKPIGTAFQQQVWQALLTIPFSETCSYQTIAKKVNNIKACQAVGAANGKNPISIIIPCHRVIGKNGELTGYAGGLSKKSYLLALEQKGMHN